MWPDRRLIKLLHIEHPLVLAPMAGVGTVELAAAVCAAGGLGSIGCAGMQPALAAKTIQALRALTDKPINVNFFCHVQAKADAAREKTWSDRLSPYYRELGIERALPRARLDLAPFDDSTCRVVEDAKPEVVSFHFGLPELALLARVKAAGCRVMASATTIAEALWLEARGVDLHLARLARRSGLPISSVLKQQPHHYIAMPSDMDTRTRPSLQTCSRGDLHAPLLIG